MQYSSAASAFGSKLKHCGCQLRQLVQWENRINTIYVGLHMYMCVFAEKYMYAFAQITICVDPHLTGASDLRRISCCIGKCKWGHALMHCAAMCSHHHNTRLSTSSTPHNASVIL